MSSTTPPATPPSGATYPDAVESDGNLLAALDIGTNSVRMSLVRLDPAVGTWSLVSQHKETVRLGQGEFAENRLSDEAIARGVLVLSKFAEIARGRGASEIVAIATAAMREAQNRDEFIERARDWAGVEVQVVSGVEEARLIYLGVISGLELGKRRGLFIDIGGGSTELIVGTQQQHYVLESLKLGAIRLGNRFLTGMDGAVPHALYETMRQYARGVATHAYRKIEHAGFDVAVASSGTAMNLAAVAARRAGQDPATFSNYTLKAEELREVAAMLCGLTLEERRRVPGLNPERADIIVSGAAVLHTLADDLKIDGFLISDRSLREGVLVDALIRRLKASGHISRTRLPHEAGVRRRSVDRLARINADEKRHARHVAHLTLRLFDQAGKQGLHDFGAHDRELLEYASLLHDIGVFVSHSGHHRHSYYLIRNAEMAGFTDEEIEVVANLAYFHRKSPPKKRHAHFQELPARAQQFVRQASALLRLAEGLDRSHLGLVRDVTLDYDAGARAATLTLHSDADPRLEVWYVGNEKAVLEEAFGVTFTVRAANVPEAPAAV
ncbi:MAG TPA: Ppx/GppA phosphatase family protein [Armatimonadaceae bacterium]|nr:Ppx/GppA phosphatase family protein [Armatimonadaceae bacterium]